MKKNKINYEVYDNGPVKIERIGRSIKFSSNWKPEEFKAFQDKLKENRPKVREEIDKKIKEVLSILHQYNPLELLPIVFLKNSFFLHNQSSEVGIEKNETFIEYALSLTLSQKYDNNFSPITAEISDKFNELLSSIFKDVLWYFCTEAVGIEKKDKDKERLKYISRMRFLIVRGDSIPEHHEVMIGEIFSKHNDFFQEKYGLSINQILVGMKEIENQIINNLINEKKFWDKARELHDLFKDFTSKNSIEGYQTFDDYMKKYEELPEVLEKRKELEVISKPENICEVFPSETIPEILLNQLSSNYGENALFALFEKAPGWPTNNSIIHDRPLLFEKNKYYCFSPQFVFRNSVSILERFIEKKDKYYFENNFSKSKAKYLEDKAIEYFQNLLPGCRSYKKLFYKIHVDGKNIRAEADGLVVFDNNIFLIEAKSGDLSLAARRGSIERIKRDTKELIDNAYKQSLRTKKYIQENSEPKFEYENGSEALILRNKEQYKNIFLINVTFQNLSELATQLNSLKQFDLIDGTEWIWSVFINDLKVISELIEFPSAFLLYLKRRIRANDYPMFRAFDELDYLMYFYKEGLYFENSDIKKYDSFGLNGYSQDIDKYYDFLAGRAEKVEKPELERSKSFKDLILSIEATKKYGFSKVTTTLLSCDIETQEEIIKGIEQIVSMYLRDHLNHDSTLTFDELKLGLMFSVFSNNNITIFEKIKEHCKLKKYELKYDEWILIIISIENGKTQYDFEIYRYQWQYDKEMEVRLNHFKIKKLEQTRMSGIRVGRNDLCPCKSGKKFKKCCMIL